MADDPKSCRCCWSCALRHRESLFPAHLGFVVPDHLHKTVILLAYSAASLDVEALEDLILTIANGLE